MAEAVGLGASVLAFATIAAQLSKAILAVWGSIKDTPEDIRRVAGRLNTLEFILNQVHEKDLTTPDGTKHKTVLFWAEQSNQLDHDFAEYKALAEKLIALLNKENGSISISSARTKFHWFFKRDEVYALGKKLKTHIETFQTILVFLTFDVVQTSSSDIQELKQMNARSAKQLDSLKPVTRDELANEISVWKTEFTRSLQQAIPFEPRYIKKASASTTVESTITTSSSIWCTYHLPVGTLRVTRGLKRLDWMRNGNSKNDSAAHEMTSGIMFDFTPELWFMNKAVVGAFMLYHKKYSGVPTFTQMIWSSNMLPSRHAALHAARGGDVPKLQALFSEGLARPNDRDGDGRTLLHLAALHHRYDMSAFLINEGADCNAVDKFGRTALHEVFTAAPSDTTRNKFETQRLLRLYKGSGCDSTIVARRGQSAFSEGLLQNLWGLFAKPEDSDDQFQNIFNVLQDFEEIDEFDPLPLSMALCTAYSGLPSSQNLVEGAVKRWLKTHGKGFYDLDDRESYRKVLLQALKHKAAEMTPDQADSVMRYACIGQSDCVTDVIRVLVRPNIVTGDRGGGEEGLGFSALTRVAENGNLEAVNILLAAGANTESIENETAFRDAIIERHFQVARRLLDFGYYTPRDFLCVVERGLVEFASIFLERGMDINQRLQANNRKRTVLFWAAERGELEMVDFLVKHGADVLIRDTLDLTASSLALKNKQSSVAEFLLREEERAKLRQESNDKKGIIAEVLKPIFPASKAKASNAQAENALSKLTPPKPAPEQSTPAKQQIVYRWSKAGYINPFENPENHPPSEESQDLDTHSKFTIDSWDSLKTLTSEDMLLIAGGILVTLWGLAYIYVMQLLGFLWNNRKYVTVRNIKIVFWGLCTFSSSVFLVGYLLGRRKGILID